MFERYTERARRVIFYARYEASQFGSPMIETEHLLLGLLREDKNMVGRFLQDLPAVESIGEEIKSRTTSREKASNWIDLPLTNECKRILAYALEESESLKHRQIGTEHLLMGILREEECLAATILYERRLRLDAVRQGVSHPSESFSMQFLPNDVMVRDSETATRIAIAIWLAAYGGKTAGGVPSVDLLVSHVWRVTAGPLFAFIQGLDGKVLSMGIGSMGNHNV